MYHKKNWGCYAKTSSVIALLIALAMSSSVWAADAISIGVGQSTLTDAVAAMNAAADTAKTALGTKTATIVIAWVDSGNETAFSQLAAKFTADRNANLRDSRKISFYANRT